MPRSIVLLIEDHDDTRLAERLVLEDRGYEVVEARTGLDGLTLSLATHPCVILLDMVLPGIDGAQLARMLRADRGPPRVALVAMSASDDPVMRARAFNAGCDEFLAKPVSPYQLSRVVGRYAAYAAYAAEVGP